MERHNKMYKLNNLLFQNGGTDNIEPTIVTNLPEPIIISPVIAPIKLTESKLDDIYKLVNLQNIVDDINLDDKEKNHVKSTYGEILFESLQKLINEINIGSSDVFYDLGSGNGKVVMQMFMNANVKKSYGIEYYPERSYNAEFALKQIYKMFPETLDEKRLISYQIGNIKDIHYLDDATVIFMCSTCYPSELLEIVCDKIKTSKNIRCLITHKSHDKIKDFLPNHTTTVLSCTWSKDLIWNVYRK